MKINAILVLSILVLFGCSQPKVADENALDQEKGLLLSAPTANASNPFLTKNHLGQSVFLVDEVVSRFVFLAQEVSFSFWLLAYLFCSLKPLK